MYRSENLEARR